MERKASKKFEDVVVWQKAHQFVLEIYKLSQGFPKSEIYALTSQFRRAAISIPANIAEGFRRKTKTEKIRFYNIAQGSLEESRYYLILTNDLGYADTKALLSQLDEVGRILSAYANAIKSNDQTKP